MQLLNPFTADKTAQIESLCADITQRIGRKVTPEYGETEDGEYHDVALCVDSLPTGAWGTPGPLTTILTGPLDLGGGFTVMRADGSALADRAEFGDALKAARFAGVREYRAMCDGALQPVVRTPRAYREGSAIAQSRG
jgi:hypothetical protein